MDAAPHRRSIVAEVVVVTPPAAAAAATAPATPVAAAAAAAASAASAATTATCAAAAATAVTPGRASAAEAAAASATEAAATSATEAARRTGSSAASPAAATLTLHGGVAADAAPVECRAVHGLQRRFAGCIVGEGDEAEATTPAGVTVLDHDRIDNFAKGFKRSAQRRVVRRPRQSANKQLHGVLFLFSFADRRGRMVVLPRPAPTTSRSLGGVLTTLESYQ
jgi:hypothetical protein